MIDKGSVYTLRPRKRKEGIDTAFYGNYFKKTKIGRVKIRYIGTVRIQDMFIPTVFLSLKRFVRQSGFRSLEDWLMAAKNSTYLYKVLLVKEDK